MDKYAKVEKLLSNYKMLKISIENMEQDIQYLNEEDGFKGVSFDRISTSPTNITSDIVGDVVINKLERVEKLEQRIEQNKRDIVNIDRILLGLSETERIAVTEFYINGRQWYDILPMLKCSESTAKRERKKAIYKLMLGIDGKGGN